MVLWKRLLVLVSLLAASVVHAEGTCAKGFYPPKCYPCLGCEPCNDGSGQFCDTTGGLDVRLVHTGGHTGDLDFSDGTAEFELDSTTVTTEFRPRGFSFGGGRGDPFVTVGVGVANARFVANDVPVIFDDDAKVLSGSAGVRFTHWSRWGAEFGLGYRTLFDAGTTTRVANDRIDTTIDFSSFDAGLLLSYNVIPDRLTIKGGIRAVRGDLDIIEAVAAEGRPFTRNERVDVDRDDLVAGAEFRLTRRLTAEAEVSSDGDTTQSLVALRFNFGGKRRLPSSESVIPRSVDLGCVPRRSGWGGCSEEGWGCLVMFPESDWPFIRSTFGDPAVTFDGTATVRQGRLHYEFKAPLPADVTSIPVDRDTPLRNTIAESLGFEHLTIVAGNYTVNRSVGRHGAIDFELSLGSFPAVGARPILRFKHSFGCETPLGICLIIPIGWAPPDVTLTPAQIADGYGFATMEVVDGKLLLTPHRPAALPDGTLPIDEDKRLETDLAVALGYKNIVIKRGIYRMNMAYGEYGRAVLDIDATPVDPPQAAVRCQLYSHVTGFCTGCGVACNDGTNYSMNCAADIFTGPMGNVCGGQHHRYNRGVFASSPQLFRGAFEATSLDAKFHTYDEAGADSCDAAASTRFTMIVPKQ